MINRLPAPSCLKNVHWRKFMATFLAFVFSLASCLGIILYFHAKETIDHNFELILNEQQMHISMVKTMLHQELNNLSTNFLAFTNSPGILQILVDPHDQTHRQRVNESLSNFIRTTDEYAQIQAFDNNGREFVRVEKRGRQTAIIPIEELETNSANDFLDGLQLLGPGQAAISPIILARDKKGELRRPFRPIFRMVAPIFDQHNQKIGALLFTYKGQPLLDLFTGAMARPHEAGGHYTNNPQILNHEGYWLLAPDKKDEWGFVRDPQRRFDRRFPEVWQAMRQQGQGQIRTADGLFTFVTLPLVADKGSVRKSGSAHPAPLGKEVQQEAPPFLILLNQVFPEELARLNIQTQRTHLFLFLIVILVSLPLFLWLTMLLRNSREDKKELRIQEQRFRLLYDKAPLPYMSLDQEGHLLNINQTWLTALGYTRNEVIGRWFSDFVASQSLPHFQDSFSLFMETGEIKNCELELVRKDGSTLLASFHGEHIENGLETFSQAHCIFTDITELRAEQQRTEHLNILLQTFIEIHRLIGQERERKGLVQRCCEILIANRGYSSSWIILLDKNGKIAIRAESGLLHHLDQLERQINTGNLPPCILECRERQGMVVIDTPLLFCGECPTAGGYPRKGILCAPLEYKSNVYGYLHVSLPTDFIQNQDEKNLFSEIARDIGYALFNLDQQLEKIQAETSLRASEERLRSITDSAQDAILVMDPLGAISFWNPASEKIFGYRAEEVLGKNLHTLLAPSRYHAAQQAAFPEFLRSGHGNAIGKTIELSALRKDGREIPVTLSLSAVFQNGSWHAVGIMRDISDRKRMEEQMMQSEKMTIIAGLAAGVAHEINTPLSAILQSIQVIRQSLSPDLARNQEIADHCGLDLTKVQDYFAKREIIFFMDGIRDSAIKSAKIIANLLQFSRPQKVEFVETDLGLLLDKAVALAKNDYDLKKKYDILNIEISREYTPNLPLVSCMAMDIEQVFINLLKNAVQAMGDRPGPGSKSRITLRTLHLNEIVRVEIADNGPGMDEETRRHIFDPFFTTKDIGVGTGLGLTVSYAIIVTKHGGQLTVQSAPGQGVTFTIDLPLDNEDSNTSLKPIIMPG